jgi:hypothetical protein
MKVIGLAGKAGAGKDYVYETIDAALATHNAVRRMAFADGVKTDIEDALNGGRSMLSLWEKPYTHEVRSLLQWWGTDFRRNESETYWVDYGLDQLRYLQEMNTDVVCVTDVRFQNEVDALNSIGGVVFEVVAPNSVRAERLNISESEQQAMSRHATEAGGLNSLDGVIDNTGYPVWPQRLNEYLELPKNYRPTGDIRPEWAK